jgi:hypothetical protein
MTFGGHVPGGIGDGSAVLDDDVQVYGCLALPDLHAHSAGDVASPARYALAHCPERPGDPAPEVVDLGNLAGGYARDLLREK